MPLFFILGFVAISFIGSMLHFVYDFLNHNKYASLFVAVNESTWEHLKLAMFPTFIWAVVGLMFPFNNYAFGVFVALFIATATIPAIFYSYTHFTKKPLLAVDISSFFVAVALAMFASYKIMNANPFPSYFNIIGIVGTILYVLFFMLFTIFPPHHFLFLDPITNEYGRKGHYVKEKFSKK